MDADLTSGPAVPAPMPPEATTLAVDASVLDRRVAFLFRDALRRGAFHPLLHLIARDAAERRARARPAAADAAVTDATTADEGTHAAG